MTPVNDIKESEFKHKNQKQTLMKIMHAKIFQRGLVFPKIKSMMYLGVPKSRVYKMTGKIPGDKASYLLQRFFWGFFNMLNTRATLNIVGRTGAHPSF